MSRARPSRPAARLTAGLLRRRFSRQTPAGRSAAAIIVIADGGGAAEMVMIANPATSQAVRPAVTQRSAHSSQRSARAAFAIYAIGSVADSSDVFAGVHAKLERQSAGPSAQQNPAVDLVERPRENRARHAALSNESLRISHAARVERQARAEMNRTNTLSRVAIGGPAR